MCFVGAPIPGINRSDWSALREGATSEGIFVSADWRAAFEAGRYALRPLTWFQTYGWLGETPLDAAVFQVSPPDDDGMVTLSVASDLAPAVMARPEVFKLALVNPNLPAVNGPRWPLEAFDLVADDDSAVLDYDAGDLDPAFEVISRHIAGIAPDGASLQFGVGKAGVAALKGLRGRKGLKIHSGMVTDPLVELLDEEVVDSVVTGLAAGTARLRDRLTDPRIRFADSGHTHHFAVLANIPRLVAVNSALEIDLFGQANAEFQGGRQISGIGGLTDFLRGARLSDGGLPILALPASAKGDSISRIVPRLSPGVVSVPRADIGLVITEHGVADLRGRTLDERAQALIGVASPAHRDALSNAWDEMRRGL
ncbi:acetyl-CoA hydrolase/transferase C-terminal domain-containing protein [Caulobacter sp. NIBR1757]|uniref:acetyl-CoA hydrolase/transferase family protein n=1 Tax=Caulobacter sp. NIBR1757 TaxID=3016000 RepID=UPI0022F0E5C6|nr:acetyl-CoA hydrolase/transferase C-terminal domain-containing protein [Caulobacter sp. NIBR1757]